MPKVHHLFKGKPSPLPTNPALISAINRTPCHDLNIFIDQIEGDAVFNKFHHGGPQRIIHYYPLQHYDYWRGQFPETSFLSGSMGENVNASDLLEQNVCIGDLFQMGEVLCAVTEPRKPCATINYQFKINSLARLVQESGRTGWFFKVITPGKIRVGDEIFLKDRPYPELNIASCVEALLVKPDPAVLELMAKNQALSENWRGPSQEFLKTGVLPDDRKRLGEI
ncbi:MAG: MOSC domain-containing protein [Bacteriovoracaceae bacterium]|nr:MOSC domain-containing protein [Bacteriovoracaceae bacterium]